MKNDEIENWAIYWAGIGFILFCLFRAFATEVSGQEDPCQWEIDNAKSVCRAMGRKSPECAQAIEKIDMCRSEGSNDPLEGLQVVCKTTCVTSPITGVQHCTTTCR